MAAAAVKGREFSRRPFGVAGNQNRLMMDIGVIGVRKILINGEFRKYQNFPHHRFSPYKLEIHSQCARAITTLDYSHHVLYPTLPSPSASVAQVTLGTLHIKLELQSPTQTLSSSAFYLLKAAGIRTSLESMGVGDEQPALQVIVLVSTLISAFIQQMSLCCLCA